RGCPMRGSRRRAPGPMPRPCARPMSTTCCGGWPGAGDSSRRRCVHADSYDYAVIRVVPRVERGEFINAGVLLSCEARQFLQARTVADAARLRALDPTIDVELVARHLAAIERICAGA